MTTIGGSNSYDYTIYDNNTASPPPPPSVYTQVKAGDFNPLPLGSASLGMSAPLASSMTDVMSMMLAMKTMIDEMGISVAKGQVETIKAERQQKCDERLEKLKEFNESTEKAKKGGVVGEIFGWIAAAAMTIAGAILIGTGVGAAAGVALLAAGVTMLVMQTLQSDSLGKAVGLQGSMMNAMVTALANSLVDNFGMDPEKAKVVASAIIVGTLAVVAMVAGTVAGGPLLGLSLVAQILPAFFTPENLQGMGVSEEDAPWVALGINVGLAVLSIASGAGAAKAASSGAQIATGAEDVGRVGSFLAKLNQGSGMMGKAMTAAAEAASTGAEIASQSAKLTAVITKYTGLTVSALSTIGQGGAQIYSGVETGKAGNAQADAAKLQAALMQLQQYFQQQADQLQEIMDQMQDGFSVVVAAMKETDALDKKILHSQPM